MEINEARPDDKLPYKGAWLWVGDEMIHLMELPNPDPADGRPEHGGRDRHVCLVSWDFGDFLLRKHLSYIMLLEEVIDCS